MGKITSQEIAYCPHCVEHTNHIPKMDAVKNGQRVCEECSHSNYYYDREKLLGVYMNAFNQELDGEWSKETFDTLHEYSAHMLGKIHAEYGDDMSSLDYMGDDEIIREIIEDSNDTVSHGLSWKKKIKNRCDECGTTLNDDHSCPECHSNIK